MSRFDGLWVKFIYAYKFVLGSYKTIKLTIVYFVFLERVINVNVYLNRVIVVNWLIKVMFVIDLVQRSFSFKHLSGSTIR